ncbi:MAG: hypothetical protein JNN26_16265 [Candidatus Obscuribacter sp.]|nr:hypothetical protein [Candidatus Obscuribacter sp.]
MKAKGIFISTLAAINAYLGGFAYGFNTHPVLVIDATLPPVVQKKSEPVKTDTPAAVAKQGVAAGDKKSAGGAHEGAKSNAGKSGKSAKSGTAAKSDKPASKAGAKSGAIKSGSAKNDGASGSAKHKPH